MMPSEQISARRRAAWEAEAAARRAASILRQAQTARVTFEKAKGLCRTSAPHLVAEVERVAQQYVQHARPPMVDPTARGSVIRAVDALRSEGVPIHRIAAVAIRAGICTGPYSVAAVTTCEARLRQQRRRLPKGGP